MVKHPGRIRDGMDRLIAQERDDRHSDPEKAAECISLRGAYQDQQAAGLTSLTELGSKLEELESIRRMAEAEIAALEAHEERVAELERDRETLLEFYAGTVHEALDQLDGEEQSLLDAKPRDRSAPVRPPRRAPHPERQPPNRLRE